jgi:hypothetical protein
MGVQHDLDIRIVQDPRAVLRALDSVALAAAYFTESWRRWERDVDMMTSAPTKPKTSGLSG